MKQLVITSLLVILITQGAAAQGEQTLRLSVDGAVERALEHGFEVAESQAEIDAAEAAHRSAKALYGPRIMVEAKALYFNERPTFELDFLNSSQDGSVPLWLDQALSSLIPEGPMEAGEQYNVDFSVRIVQPLTKLESIAELSKIRGLDVEIANSKREKTLSELAFQVREASHQLLELRSTIRALEETEQEILARQKQIEAFRQAELVGPEDVLEVHVKLAELQQGLIKAKAYEGLSQLRLRHLLRLDSQENIEIEEPTATPPLPDVADCKLRALEHRAELNDLRLKRRQAESGIRAKIQEFLPDVSLVGSYQYQAGTSFGQPELALGAVMSWTPFAWGETYHALREAKARARQVELALERAESLIGLEIEANHATAKVQFETIAVAKTRIEHAEELYRIERARLDVQHSTATDLLAAQTALLRARLDHDSARYSYLTALAALQKSFGETGLE
jgi:outer membrane protein